MKRCCWNANQMPTSASPSSKTPLQQFFPFMGLQILQAFKTATEKQQPNYYHTPAQKRVRVSSINLPSNAFWALSASSWFLSGCTNIDSCKRKNLAIKIFVKKRTTSVVFVRQVLCSDRRSQRGWHPFVYRQISWQHNRLNISKSLSRFLTENPVQLL